MSAATIRGYVLSACACAFVSAACSQGDTLNPAARTPYSARRIALPAGSTAVAVEVDDEGGALVALADGRIAAVDPFDAVTVLDREPGETPTPSDAPVSQFVARGPGQALAVVPSGALLVQNGLVRRAELPLFLTAPHAFTPFGTEALWGANDGLYTSEGDRWLRLDSDSGPLADVSALVSFSGSDGAREAWVQTSTSVRRLRYVGGAMPDVTWSDVAADANLGDVRGIAALDGTRGAIAGANGVAIVTSGQTRVFRAASDFGAPVAVAGGGGHAWVVWGGRVLRTDGEQWESLASDPALVDHAHIAVDGSTGNSALLIDANGGLIRVQSAPALWLSGMSDGATLFDATLELTAVPTATEGLVSIAYAFDGVTLVTHMTSPWGIADDGSRERTVYPLHFGAHSIDVTATYADGHTLQRTVHFQYASPLGRVPSYATDVAPLFAARCARCHTNGVAHNLDGYDALRREGVLVRSAVIENRMPPDLLLDPQSTAVFAAWVDGMTPP